jgi:hypothetical protein
MSLGSRFCGLTPGLGDTLPERSFTKTLDEKLPRPTFAIERLGCNESCGFVVPHELLVSAGPAINSQQAQASSQAVGTGMIQ